MGNKCSSCCLAIFKKSGTRSAPNNLGDKSKPSRFFFLLSTNLTKKILDVEPRSPVVNNSFTTSLLAHKTDSSEDASPRSDAGMNHVKAGFPQMQTKSDNTYENRSHTQDTQNTLIKQRLLEMDDQKANSGKPNADSGKKGMSIELIDKEMTKKEITIESSPKKFELQGDKEPLIPDKLILTIQSDNNVKENSQLKWIAESTDLFTSIITKTQAPLAEYELVYEEKKEENKLKIYMQSYVTADKNRITRTRTEWLAPCTAEQFIKFMNTVTEQNKLDNNMTDFRQVEVFGETETTCNVVYYLAYKKVLIVSARDFVYAKHFKQLNDTTWCDASRSVIHPQCPVNQDKIRGEIILSGHYVTNIIEEASSRRMAKVCMYSESDFKTNVPYIMTKSVSKEEIRKYVEKCIGRIRLIHPPSYQEVEIKVIKEVAGTQDNKNDEVFA